MILDISITVTYTIGEFHFHLDHLADKSNQTDQVFF